MLRRPLWIVAIAAGSLLCAGCARGARAASPSNGAALFARNCAACHGAQGTGGPIGPALTGEHHRADFTRVMAQIEDPVPPMPKL